MLIYSTIHLPRPYNKLFLISTHESGSQQFVGSEAFFKNCIKVYDSEHELTVIDNVSIRYF